MDKYDIIVAAEQQFAREVTLGVIVARPLTAWHYIIPGFFIIDFLRRGSAIRQYTKHFMFPRKLAIDAAVAQMQGKIKVMPSDLQDHVGRWLESLKLYSPDLVSSHVALIEILAVHYLKLLTAQGNSYHVLIENAYQDRDMFNKFIGTITAAENEVDGQVIERLGGNEMARQKILAEQQQIARRRQKILDEVF